MKPLFVLLLAFVICLFTIKLAKGHYRPAMAGRIAMSVMLLFTSIGHFMFTDGTVMMLPDFIPFKVQVVYATGIMEIAAAVTLLIPRLRLATGWFLIVFFIVMLPANIYASLHYVDYQKATLNGPGPEYLWFRIPLQLFFIAWVYLSSIKNRYSTL